MSKSKLPLLLALLAVVLVVFAGVYSKSKSSALITPEKQFSPTPTVSKYPIDTENDGVYINYEYGFKFKYPEEIFSIQDGVRYFKGLTTYRFREPEGMWLNFEIFTYPEAIEDFSKVSALGINQYEYSQDQLNGKEKSDWPQENRKKIASIFLSTYRGYLAYVFPTGGGDGSESSFGYATAWNKNNVIMSVSVYSRNRTELESQLKIIKDILNSIEFFTPVPMS